MNVTGLSALAALLCEGAAEALHGIAQVLGGHDLVREAERAVPAKW
ncbi:MAG: hypothetical protein ACM3UO_00480 [Bacillota bacterium]